MQKILASAKGNRKRIVSFTLFSLVVLCLCCVSVYSNLPSSSKNPTKTPVDAYAVQTSVKETVFASAATATNEPTATTAPPPATPTSSIDVADALYMLELQSKFAEFQEYFEKFLEYHESVTNDITLIADSEWKTKMGITLGMLQVSANAVADIPPTPRYEEVHAELVNLAKETELMTTFYARAVDNIDSAALEKSIQHMSNMNAIARRATALIESANSAP